MGSSRHLDTSDATANWDSGTDVSDEVAEDVEIDVVEITLLYIRPCRTRCKDDLDAQLQTLVHRYAPAVALIAFESDDIPSAVVALFPELLSPWVGLTPMVLVLRRGELIGEAIGGSLPMRELDSVVRCAVEWPA